MDGCSLLIMLNDGDNIMTEIIISDLNREAIIKITKYHNEKFNKDMSKSEIVNMLLWESIKYYVLNDYITLYD